MKRYWIISTLLVLFSSVATSAQIGVYGQFNAAKLNVPQTGWIYGPTVGAYFASTHFVFLSTGVDFRGTFLGNSGSTKLNSGLGGLRLGIKPRVLPIQPYIEGLVGVGHVEFGQGAAQTSATKLEYQFLGGLDFTLLPHIDWRVVEFSYGGLSGLDNSLNPKTLSTGIVLRLR
jgi:hypothetical protein